MRIRHIASVALFGAVTLGCGSALAANSNPEIALSGRLGGMTCSHFTHLGKSSQSRLVSRSVASAPGSTLATIPPVSGGADSSSAPGQGTAGVNPQAATSSSPLKPSVLVAACQGSSGATTLREAYAKFSQGSSIIR